MRVNGLFNDGNYEIVIVDNTVEYLKLLSDILTNEGYSVRSFNSGELALLSIKENHPSLIFLDFAMPVMDGYEVCRQLKADEDTSDIPVIFFGELEDDESILTGFQVGGVDFISKPFRKEEVLARVKTHISLFHFQLDFKTKNELLQEEVIKRKKAELALVERITTLTQPIENSITFDFGELFNIAELQILQDQFASAFGVASIITQPDGTPITRPSNFSRLCENIIRCTEKGRLNCMHSDAVIGRHNPEGPVVQPCLSGGLWDAGASITVGGKHIASWLVGQVRNEAQEEGKMAQYAREIGADETDFMQAFSEITSMSQEQFQKISEVLFTMAGQLSTMAYQNILQTRFINERKEAESALLESEDRFRTTLYSIGDGVITTDSSGKVSMMNPVAEQLTGWSQAEAAGKILEEVFPIINEETRTQVEIPVRKVLREGVIVGLANHTLLVAKDGTERPIADSGAPIRNKSGETVGVVLVFQDQTEERKAEKKILESEFFFRESQRAAYLGSYKFDLVTGFWDSSDVLDHIFGIGKEYVRDVAGWKDLILADDLGMMDKHLTEHVIGKRKPFNKEYRIIRKSDGIVRWVNGLGQLNLDADGNILSLIGTIQDITKRKRTDDVLKESEEKFRSLFENAAIGISITKMDGTMQINPVLHEMLGYTEAEFRNIKWQEITHPDDIQISLDLINSLVHGKTERFRIEKRYLHKNGSIIWTDISTTLNRDGNNNPLYFITSINDITHRKIIEQALRKSEERFRKAITEAPFPIMIHADNDEIVAISRGWTEMSGYEISDIPNTREWTRLAYGIEQATVKSYIDSLYGIDHWVDEGEYEIHAKCGEKRIWDFSSSPLGKLSDERRLVISMAKDVTSRKKTEDALFEAERMMKAFFEQSMDGFFFMMLDEPIEWNEMADKDKLLEYAFSNQRITRINDAMLEQYGANRDQFVGLTPNDMFNHNIQHGKNEWRKLFDQGKLHTETQEQKLNGEPIIIEGDYTCLYDSEGLITGHFGIQRDITETKLALETIQNERQLMRTLIDHLPDPIYVKDHEGRKLIANLADLENIGALKESEVLGKSDLEIFNNEIGHRGYEDDFIVIENGEPIINREEIFFDKNGVKRWLLTTKIPILNKSGKATGLVGIGRDITEQKKAYETIQKLSKSIEQSPSTIVITDVFGNIEYVNPKFIEITGYTYEEAVGQNPRILKSGEMSPEKYKELWDIISSGGVWRGEFHNRRKNGELYWEWATMTSIKDEYGIIINYIAIKEDISIRKQMEADLIIAKDKAEESDRLKSAFLANMSHEIRTPLNSIIGFSELLDDADFEADQKKEFVHHIISNGNNLLNIISDIMDISKMESGEITIRKSKIDVIQFLDEIRSMHVYNVEQKNLRLNIDYLPAETDAVVFVNADKERLQQIFNNMISNALKFTSEGHIQFGFRLAGEMVEFHVKDTGIGIPVDYHHKVFDRFRQVEASYTRKFGGNGLGLAISKNLVELMEGKIWVESEPGKGSAFYFTLPRS